MTSPARLRVIAFVTSVTFLCLGPAIGYAAPALAHAEQITTSFPQNWDPPKPPRKHPKIDSVLLAIAEASQRGSAALAESAHGNRVVQRGEKIRMLVESVGVDTAPTRAAIAAARGDVDAEYSGVVRAFVAPGALEGLAQHPAVRWIARPGLMIADGLIDEGVVASNASAWHTAGWDGRDVKIAIIDGGFIGYSNAVLNGDLPMQTITQDFGCGGPELDVGVVSPHGTAVARIVHQMAPAAQLYLLCVDDVVGLGQAKDYAVASGVKIINQSLGWFNTGRGDGTGGAATVDGIAASARTSGILWVNSAGNLAQRHWSGPFTSFDGDVAHDFAVGDNLNDLVLTAGVQYCAALKWDAWPTTNLDYDLYLVRMSTNGIVAGSENIQTGTQAPVESLCYTSATTETYGLGIIKFSAASSPRFDLFSLEANLQYQTTPGSLSEPGSSPSVMAVGAICWQNDSLQSYSSQGPTIDGRIKPDIAGHDATSSDVYGAASGCVAGFRGTSASAPHVAGAAGLALQANPTFTPAQLQAFLEGRAVDLGTGGRDNQYGMGKLWLGTAPVPPAVGAGTYQDTHGAINYSGTWTSWADAGHSGGSVKHANTTGASTSLTFTGSSVALVYAAQFNTGIATVTIDGTPVDQLDTYSPSQQFQRRKTYTTSAGTHTVSVAVSGNKNASSSGTYVVFDAYIVTVAPPAVGVGTYQDTHSAINFSGTWTSWADAVHSDGSVKYANATGASASLTYTGSALTLVYVAQFNTGIATVTIDGTPVDQLDMYSAAQGFQRQKTYTTTAGTHTVSVAVSGNKNASSSGTYVVFDALIVSTAPPAVGIGTYQDTSSSLNLNGDWTSWADAGHSGGTVRYANTTGASASLTFTGSSLTLVYVAQFNTGIATVTMDGTAIDQLDTYSATQSFQRQKSYTTTAGTHTVSVAVSGNKNASSSGTYVVFDAYIVSDAPPAFGPGTYEDTNNALNFSGTWTSWADAGHSGGSVKHSNTTGANVSLNVTGSSLTLVYVAQFNTGIATVAIDGTPVDQLDTYSATQQFQRQKTYAIAPGAHVVSVVVSGNKNASSSGTYVVFDALIVSNAPPPVAPGAYEDTGSAITFSGTWTSWADPAHSGGSVKYANETGASASLSFAGDAIMVTYVAQYNTGIATVMIDGIPVDQLDTYSAVQGFQRQQIYSTTNGTHTVSVLVSGNKNAVSSAAYIVFDNFVVSAPAPYVTMDSDAGDYIGQGQFRQFTGANATFITSVPQAGTYIRLQVNPVAGGGWLMDFAAPLGQPLVPGVYINAQRAAFRTGTSPGIDISGDGRGCNTVTGSFTVYAIAFSPSGALEHFDATYEHHCEGGPAALRGAVKL
jgi:hypothetical protein